MWTVRYGRIDAIESDLAGGVAVIESGRLFGGDSGYAYKGEVNTAGHTITGTLTIIRHDPSVMSIYGRDEDQFELAFEASRVSDARIEGSFKRPGFPSARLVMTRIAELP